LQIRNATLDDAESIARIHVAAWRTTYRGLIPDEFLAKLDPLKGEPFWRVIADIAPPRVFVLEDAGEVMGFCHIASANDDDTDDSIGEIIALYLSPPATGRGYGRKLCEHALEQLRERGFREIVLWVLSENAGARAFYEKLGFALDGAHKFLERLHVAGVRYRIRLGQQRAQR
jgi:ribosomal protein S18 acetylase RimI-like enzyme